MVLADRAPQSRGPGDADPIDGLALGLAQASALAPGVSRNGATLAAARARGFNRRDANVISRQIALPVIVGAAALKGVRLATRRDLPPGLGRGMAVGASTAFGSTLVSMRLIQMLERSRSLLPYALYRALFAAVVLLRLGRRRGRRPSFEAGREAASVAAAVE